MRLQWSLRAGPDQAVRRESNLSFAGIHYRDVIRLFLLNSCDWEAKGGHACPSGPIPPAICSAQVAHQRLIGAIAVVRIANLAEVKEDAAAVAGEGGEAGHLDAGVDLGAEIHGLQGLAVERGALVEPQPLRGHVAEQAAEAVVDQLLQRNALQLRQGGIAIAEDPIHGALFAVEHHFDVGEGEGHGIEALVVAAIGLGGGGHALATEALDHALLLLLNLREDRGLSPPGVIQRLAVDQHNAPVDSVNRARGDDAAAVDANEARAQRILQVGEGHVRAVEAAVGGVNFAASAAGANVQHVAHGQHDAPPVGDERKCPQLHISRPLSKLT